MLVGTQDDSSLVGPDALLTPPSAQEAQTNPRAAFFERTDWLSFSVTTLTALTLYLVTLAPDVTLGSAGIFSVGAMYAGVAHPPGYPLSTLWAWTFINLVPIGPIAWRVAFSSAVAGALACGVIALMVSSVGARLANPASGDSLPGRRREGPLRVGCGFAAGMVFGANGAFWWRAVIQDVWTLSILLLCLVLCLLMRWIYCPDRKRYLYAAAFVYGLTLTNSQIQLALAPAIPFLAWAGNRHVARDLFLVEVLLFAGGLEKALAGDFFVPGLEWGTSHPLFKLFVVWGVVATGCAAGLTILTRRLLSEWKAIVLCAVVFVLGLVPYFYAPVASMTNPPVNWGYTRTVQGFFHVITRGQYERIHPTNEVKQYAKQIRAYGAVTAVEFGWPYVGLALVPFLFIRRMAPQSRNWMLGLLAAYVCLTFLMLAVLNPSVDRMSLELNKVFFSASYVVLALWLGYGLALLGLQRAKSSTTMPV
jgi:hypothetical protein